MGPNCRFQSAELVEIQQQGLNSSIEIKQDSLIGIASEEGEVKSTGTETSSKRLFTSLGRLRWIRARKGQRLTITSSSEHVISKAIPLAQETKTSRDLVLVIFIDGLADIERLGIGKFDEVMPRTSDFFKEGHRATNHYANAEWTLASIPTLFTGHYTSKHGLYHPHRHHQIRNDIAMLSEEFSVNGYHTVNIGGNWRANPLYGYTRGFDRTLYKNSADCETLINFFIESNRATRNRSQFCWLSLLELHHDLNVLPTFDISATSPSYTQSTQKGAEKSVFASRDEVRTRNYFSQLSSLDMKLDILYDYIKKNYSRDNASILLVTDHGQSYLTTGNSGPLSEERVCIPFWMRSPSLTQENPFRGFTENIDIPGILLNDCGIKSEILENSKCQLPDAMGGEDRQEALCMSIFPGQTFKARLYRKEDVIDLESKFNIDDIENLSVLSPDNIKATSRTGEPVGAETMQYILTKALN